MSNALQPNTIRDSHVIEVGFITTAVSDSTHHKELMEPLSRIVSERSVIRFGYWLSDFLGGSKEVKICSMLGTVKNTAIYDWLYQSILPVGKAKKSKEQCNR